MLPAFHVCLGARVYNCRTSVSPFPAISLPKLPSGFDHSPLPAGDGALSCGFGCRKCSRKWLLSLDLFRQPNRKLLQRQGVQSLACLEVLCCAPNGLWPWLLVFPTHPGAVALEKKFPLASVLEKRYLGREGKVTRPSTNMG